MKLLHDFVRFINETKCGDSIVMENIFNDWLPIWKAGGKLNYTNLTMTNTGIFYNKMTPVDLEDIRINRCVKQNKGHSMMAIDKSCEILNDYL